MEQLQENPWKSLRFGLLLSLFLAALLYPALFSMEQFPMGQNGWELQDPVVSQWVIMPALRTWRYELLHHHNFLWSNLRGLGQPLLGNEIQAGPLFPLTLLTLVIPEPYSWNVFCLSRLILIAAFTFLVALQVLRFSRLASFVFTLSFGFGLFIVRWMNHPWQNGLLAGLIYIYFLNSTIQSNQRTSTRKGYGSILGLAFAVYCLVTCGFPESAAMAGLLALLITLIPLLAAIFRRELSVKKFLWNLSLGHALGFAVSSPQIFAILEFLQQTGPGYRIGVGVVQFDSPGILWHMLTRITDGYPPGSCIHYFHLIPLFLLVIGIYAKIKKRQFTLFDGSALLCLLFFALKFFPLWPWFNQIVGNLPIYKESWFIVYFFTIPIWFFAFYAATGAEFLWQEVSTPTSTKNTSLSVFALGTLLLLMGLLFFTVNRVPATSSARVLKHLYLLMGFVTFILWALTKPPSEKFLKYFPFAFAIFLVLEISASRPIYFLKYSQDEYKKYYSHSRPKAVEELLQKKHLPLQEIRERSGGGNYVGVGVATLDNGSPPIQTWRMSAYRTKMFFPVHESFGPSIPLLDQRTPYSYDLSSTNLYIEEKIPIPLSIDPLERKKFHFLGQAEGFYVFHKPEALSRAFLAKSCVPSTKDEALQQIGDRDRYTLGVALLENLSASENQFCKNFSGKLTRVQTLSDQGSRVELAAIAGPAVLVLNDNLYPGWRAIDRRSAKEIDIRPANFAFRGLVLPEKREYQIDFVYKPDWLKLAGLLVGMGIVAILLLTLLLLKDLRRIQPSE